MTSEFPVTVSAISRARSFASVLHGQNNIPKKSKCCNVHTLFTDYKTIMNQEMQTSRSGVPQKIHFEQDYIDLQEEAYNPPSTQKP